MTEATIQTSMKALEDLLRVELVAVEAYGNAVERVGDSPQASELLDLRREHQAAVGVVRNELARRHDQNEFEPTWIEATAPRVVGRIASLFGTASTLHTLRAGEDLLSTYLATVADEDTFAPALRETVFEHLQGGVKRRIEVLDGMLAGLHEASAPID